MERVAMPAPARETPFFTRARSGVLQRCGGHACPSTGCSKDDGHDLDLQRSATGSATHIPPIVHEVLRSSGQPLDAGARAYMEPRFGHDFSRVRVHTDARAAESASAVNALAYTVGRDVVFGAGQYAPSSTAGQRLLAHELTHVVQQNGEASLQASTAISSPTEASEMEADRAGQEAIGDHREGAARWPINVVQHYRHGEGSHLQRQALTCDIQPVIDECASAGTRCQGAQPYCTREFPTTADLDARISRIRANIDASDFGPNAKNNFKHFLDGSGSEMIMPTTVFSQHSSSQTALMFQRDRFFAGARRRIEDGSLAPGATSEVLRWTGHANAFAFPPPPRSDDLAYAVGGYQLCSNVRLKATRTDAGRLKVEFTEWKVQAFDCYNWDPGKVIGLPGLSDNDMCCIENAGKGSHFRISSDFWTNTYGPSIADGEIDVTQSPPSTPQPAPPSGAPTNPPDSRRGDE